MPLQHMELSEADILQILHPDLRTPETEARRTQLLERAMQSAADDQRPESPTSQEALRAQADIQRLHGPLVDDTLQGVMRVRAGQLRAQMDILARLGLGDLDVPTLHVEVLAIRVEAQRQGYGERLLNSAIRLGMRLRQDIGLKTVSLEATRESQAFYQRLGLERAASPWPDGSWPMWVPLS
ncbi:GNAT family N-acetyltransferase [Deinococcus ruber]|uniref:N-acetyltransferase domain-containing protein n=1 Tax=Deinococcus ruber TaxID=1848197 RepID=A0A918CMU6_9DEIO|nr:GNAT family N-acetyltransferase [Deinococcus ruber]GGR31857.1 hypothetical protein GCM10008957_48120 [Deinococcus ruber]